MLGKQNTYGIISDLNHLLVSTHIYMYVHAYKQIQISYVDARIAVELLNLVRLCFSAALQRQPRNWYENTKKKAMKTRAGCLPAKAQMSPVTEKIALKLASSVIYAVTPMV